MKRIHPKPLYWNKDFSGFLTTSFTKVSTSFGRAHAVTKPDIYRALRRNTMGQ